MSKPRCKSGWYAGLQRGERNAYLLGPYRTKAFADANVYRACVEASNIDGRHWFDTPGVFKLLAHALPPGRLNE